MVAEPQKIDDIRKQFHNEWLLIAVDLVDPQTTTPLTGQLLAHNPDPIAVNKIALQQKGLLTTLYSEDWPKDLAACFYVIIPD